MDKDGGEMVVHVRIGLWYIWVNRGCGKYGGIVMGDIVVVVGALAVL
ncbi:hypothetical protein HZI73_19040 [Vallitalea pronyensis]|uniref:Uncharacterized protein n=1 Tax=Vallitalea pronyensis TaxID=1348613 RepID=A0A8J8MM34_9FIRM|nr:hypothetical protein [Vallitalea pronyensis]QUI24260.1 hypothetical protein HZI73_19040 [Vallitalea pronyensis]